jgi:hypothetical protein
MAIYFAPWLAIKNCLQKLLVYGLCNKSNSYLQTTIICKKQSEGWPGCRFAVNNVA